MNTQDENLFPIAPREIFKIGELTVTETMLSGLITVLLIVGFFVVVRVFLIPRWRKQLFHKSALRLAVEKLVGLFDKNAKELTHGYANMVSSLYLGLSAYICVATLLELVALRPATTDLNLTLVLGVTTFVMVFALGFAKKKAKRLLHYLNPINWVTDLVVPFSMAIRVFTSVFSGFIIMHLLYMIQLPSLVFPVLGNLLLTLIHAAVQAYVFMYLSMMFINEAIE